MLESNNTCEQAQDLTKNLLLDNQIKEEKKADEKKKSSKPKESMIFKIIDRVFNRIERICVLLWHDIFDEAEAAAFCRLNSPDTSGRNTIRNAALRSKKLSYTKVGRDGLIFTKKDLANFLKDSKIQSYRDL